MRTASEQGKSGIVYPPRKIWEIIYWTEQSECSDDSGKRVPPGNHIHRNTKKILEIVERLLYNKEIQDRTKEALIKSAFS